MIYELTHPQTLMESLANNMCLLSCYFYIAAKKVGLEVTNYTVMKACIDAWRAEKVNDECYVSNPEALIKFWTGEKASVSHVNDQQEIVNYLRSGDMVIAKYSIDGKNGHFVVMQNNKIIFNSLESSRTVDKGTVVSLRVVQWH